jgi:hypothetical protein
MEPVLTTSEKAKLKKAEVVATLTGAFKRQLVGHCHENSGVEIFAVYMDEALTGWLGLVMKPWIGQFENKKCVLFPINMWLHLKAHAAETVTPFRIALKGKSIVVAAWQAISGLKYAVRNTEHGACLHIPLSEFKPLP